MRHLRTLAAAPALVLALAACSTSSTGGAEATSSVPTTAVASTTTSTTTEGSTTTTAADAASTTTAAPPTTAAPAPTPAPTAPKPTPTAAPAPKVPTLSSVRLANPLPSCNPGDALTITIRFTATNAAGVTVWSSYDGDLGQYPAEYGSVDVPYTCINGQILFTLYPVAEGGGLGAPVDLSV